MGSPAESPLKASNISEFVQKVAQAYKRRPGGAKHLTEKRISEESNITDGMTSEGSSSGVVTPSRDQSEDLEIISHKSYSFSPLANLSPPSPLYNPSSFSFNPSAPNLSDPSLLAVKVRVMETLVTSIFSTISALKSSYMQLQAAHTPYDPEKLQVADKSVIAELRRLSELKHSYVERDAIVSGPSLPEDSPAQSDVGKNKDAMLKSYEGIISNFHLEIRKRNAEVDALKDMLAETTLKKEKLERRVKRLEQRLTKDVIVKSLTESVPNSQLLESTVHRASDVARSFTKLLISLMKAAQWDLDAASDSIEPGINYARHSHRKYAFESYVCQQMWNGFENEDFYIFGSLSSILDPEKHRQECYNEFQDMRTIDPLELISANPDCLFGKFCHKKFLQLVHPKMETSFFGNFEHRNQITNGSHPNSQFYQSFLRLAKAVWLVHRLAFSFSPTASIFQVKRGTEFQSMYMESVVPNVETEDCSSQLAGQPKVGFSVMPGFRVEKTIIKSLVYIEAGKAIE